MIQARRQDFSLGEGCVWAVKVQTSKGSGGMFPREKFRKFELPWTAFRAFSWWRKRKIITPNRTAFRNYNIL